MRRAIALRPRPAAAPTQRGARTLSAAAPSPPPGTAFRYEAPWLTSSAGGGDPGCTRGEVDEKPTHRNFIGGRWEDPDDGAALTIPLRDPTNSGSILSRVPESSPSAVGRAVSSAKAAFPNWSGTPVQARQRLMLEYAHVLHKREVREEIA